jgi:hypothetical protein
VLYELLTGQPPFPEGEPIAIMLQHIREEPIAPRTIRPDVPPELDHLVLELLAKDPAYRPTDTSYVIAALRALQYTPTVKVESAAKGSTQLDLTAIDPGEIASAIQTRHPGTSPSQSAAITRVPRTEAERRQLLLARPTYWEYLYFAGQLLYERNSAEARHLGPEPRYVPVGREAVQGGQAVSYNSQLDNPDNILDYLSRRFKEGANLTERFTGLLNDKRALEQAFGAPGEEGNSERLAYLAKCWNNVYEEFLDWPASLRDARVPAEFGKLLELAARYADEPAEKYHRMVDEYVTQVDAIYDSIPASITTGKPIEVGINFTLSRRQEVLNDYVAELNRLRSLRLDL